MKFFRHERRNNFQITRRVIFTRIHNRLLAVFREIIRKGFEEIALQLVARAFGTATGITGLTRLPVLWKLADFLFWRLFL